MLPSVFFAPMRSCGRVGEPLEMAELLATPFDETARLSRYVRL